jgi:hypothetical protein
VFIGELFLGGTNLIGSRDYPFTLNAKALIGPAGSEQPEQLNPNPYLRYSQLAADYAAAVLLRLCRPQWVTMAHASWS